MNLCDGQLVMRGGEERSSSWRKEGVNNRGRDTSQLA